MEFLRESKTGNWEIEATDEERELRPHYLEAFPRYANAFDPLLGKAQETDEFQLIVAMLGIFGLQDAGWVPYETTVQAIKSATTLYNEMDDPVAARHLRLWIYGHIVEASAPYDLLANAIKIAAGEPALRTQFPDENGRPVGPGAKIRRIGESAGDGIGELLSEIWDRELRNAVSHSDYSLYGAEVRLPSVGEVRTRDELDVLTGRATAYHDAVLGVRQAYVRSYEEPKRISAASFAHDPNEEAIVIVREGEGAIGLKDAHTLEELAAGAIPFRLAKLYPDEREKLDADHDFALLPARDS